MSGHPSWCSPQHCVLDDLREHYALTLTQWNANLVAQWDSCVAEVIEPTARVWGLIHGRLSIVL